METNINSDINYYISIPLDAEDTIGELRQWPALKVAADENWLWISNIDYAKINAVEVKCIPIKNIFYAKDGKLFPENSKLPVGNIPNLLWTPIERALPVRLPALNNNLFAIQQSISMHILSTDAEQQASIMLASIDALETYLKNAPAFRLEKLLWCMVDDDKALIIGQPFLPIQGDAYWLMNRNILPVGNSFALPILAETILQTIDPNQAHYIWWHANDTYTLVSKSACLPLSRSSFKQTLQQFQLPIL
jgi:MoxR-vWA-beta-propeller ternary system domain bpX2